MKLITGATGFLGSALLQALQAQKIAARCIGLPTEQPANIAGAELVSTDLRTVNPDNKLFDSVDAIVHLAWTTIPATSMRNMAYDACSNLDITLKLLEAARIRGIKDFIFASSGGTVYGDPVRLPVREDDSTEPRSSYGIVKLTAEKYINLYSRLYGMRGVTLRISNPYGRGQLSGVPVGLIAQLLLHVRDGTPFPVWGDGSVVRDYFHIDDLARAFMAVLSNPSIASGVYNVASGHGVSIKDIVALVQKVTGQTVSIDYQAARSIDVPAIWLDIQKFRTATGWQPKIGLEEGIRSLWQSLTAKGK